MQAGMFLGDTNDAMMFLGDTLIDDGTIKWSDSRKDQ